jgi:ATP-dependent RNA helicase UAP56/SUB2
MENVRCEVFYGGESILKNEKILKDPAKRPQIVVGTPGRILDLVSPDNPARARMSLSKLKVFVLDECDKMLDSSRDIGIFNF